MADSGKLKNIERAGAQVLVCPVKNGRVDLDFVILSLGDMGIDSVMIEGGSTLAFSALQEGIVDKIVSFIAPKILGGAGAPTPVGGPMTASNSFPIPTTDLERPDISTSGPALR